MSTDMNEMRDDTGLEATRSPLDTVKDVVSGAAAKLSDALPSTDDLRAGADRAAGLIKDNPVGVVLGAVAAGFILGVLLPRTTVEAARMEDVKRMAKDAGSQAVQAGKQMVRDTVSSTLSGRRSSDAGGM